MTFELRLAVITLAVFAVASAIASLVVSRLADRVRAATPADRAAALLRRRLWPFVAALAATALAAVSFVTFEQRAYPESTGVILPALAVIGLGLWAGGVVRGLRLAVATWRLRRGWMASAAPVDIPGADVPAFAIDSRFPVVAVIGLIRPRLIIARSVLDACTADELRAIAAHENRHVRAHDNLGRAAMVATPDLLAWLPAARDLRAAWGEATEEAADDAAIRAGDDGRVLLAEALVRVARLGVTGGADRALPASALYRGEDLDRRVRRLLAPPPAAPLARRSPWRSAGTFAAACLVSALALDAIHVVIELAVTFLP
jgi:Zn-dependent protease with chaperone function